MNDIKTEKAKKAKEKRERATQIVYDTVVREVGRLMKRGLSAPQIKSKLEETPLILPKDWDAIEKMKSENDRSAYVNKLPPIIRSERQIYRYQEKWYEIIGEQSEPKKAALRSSYRAKLDHIINTAMQKGQLQNAVMAIQAALKLQGLNDPEQFGLAANVTFGTLDDLKKSSEKMGAGDDK